MIDIIEAEKVFKEYVKPYDITNGKIALKIAHIERTASVAKKLAQNLNLSKEDIELAELIGLLHDIGRFEQVRIYDTFSDRHSVNHGELGVKILFEDGLIRKFIKEDKYDEIIKKAILNHNRGKIEEGLDKRTNLHCKIIRDSDKLDIFYILTFEKNGSTYGNSNLEDEKISDEIYRECIEDRIIDYSKKQTNADDVVTHFIYVYDLNFDYSFKTLKESNNLEKIYKRIVFNDKVTQDRYNEIYNLVNKYVYEKIKKGS